MDAQEALQGRRADGDRKSSSSASSSDTGRDRPGQRKRSVDLAHIVAAARAQINQ
jgi:hypothetical protein